MVITNDYYFFNFWGLLIMTQGTVLPHLFTQYSKLKYILGISCFYHDSAASILRDGKIVACAQEERFTRKKHDFIISPKCNQILSDYCKINLSEIDTVVFYEKPLLKFERLLETYFFFPSGLKSFIIALPIWIKEKLFKKLIHNNLKIIDGNSPLNKIKFRTSLKSRSECFILHHLMKRLF